MLAMFHIGFLGLILLVVAVGISVAMIYFIASLFRSPLQSSFGLLALMIIALGTLLPYIWLSDPIFVEVVPGQVVSEVPLGSSTPPAATPPNTMPLASDPSLDALWDKLTKSRIKLDGEANEPAADPKDEVAKEAVKENFGLDEQGKLPPKWVITPPKQVGQVYRASVASDPWATEEECRQQLMEIVLPQAIARRIEYLAPSRVHRKVTVADPLMLGIGPDYILREVCRDEFTGVVDSSVGEMKKIHVLLEFDENIDNYLVGAWLQHERQTRFASFGRIAMLSLTGLAAVYGLLRFDTWSKGYYSRQLLVGGTLAIIALAVFLLRVN